MGQLIVPRRGFLWKCILQGLVGVSWLEETEATLKRKMSVGVLVFYGCETNYHKLNGLKQHTLIFSHFALLESPGMA